MITPKDTISSLSKTLVELKKVINHKSDTLYVHSLEDFAKLLHRYGLDEKCIITNNDTPIYTIWGLTIKEDPSLFPDEYIVGTKIRV